MIAQTGFCLLILILQPSSPEPFYVWCTNFCLCQVSRNERIVLCNQVAFVKASDEFLFVLGSHGQTIFAARCLIMQPQCRRIFKNTFSRNLGIVFLTTYLKVDGSLYNREEVIPSFFKLLVSILKRRECSNSLSEFISVHLTWKKLYPCCTKQKSPDKNPSF